LRYSDVRETLLFIGILSFSLIPFSITKEALPPHISIYLYTLQNEYFLNRGELVDADADASEEGEADVLLG